MCVFSIYRSSKLQGSIRDRPHRQSFPDTSQRSCSCPSNYSRISRTDPQRFLRPPLAYFFFSRLINSPTGPQAPPEAQMTDKTYSGRSVDVSNIGSDSGTSTDIVEGEVSDERVLLEQEG